MKYNTKEEINITFTHDEFLLITRLLTEVKLGDDNKYSELAFRLLNDSDLMGDTIIDEADNSIDIEYVQVPNSYPPMWMLQLKDIGC
jgi:hypothetical protein